MVDYEELILARQDARDIAEDNGEVWYDDDEVEVMYNPILIRAEYEAKDRLMKENPVFWGKAFSDFEKWHKEHPEFIY